MDRFASLMRDVDDDARRAGISAAEVAALLGPAGRWAASPEGIQLCQQVTGGIGGGRRFRASARAALVREMATARQIPPAALRIVVGFVLRLMFPEYAVAIAAINWLADWLVARWDKSPDDLIAMAKAHS